MTFTRRVVGYEWRDDGRKLHQGRFAMLRFQFNDDPNKIIRQPHGNNTCGESCQVDITFNCCTKCYVAALVYQHPLIMNDSGKAPYIIGPLLISHCRKTAVF